MVVGDVRQQIQLAAEVVEAFLDRVELGDFADVLQSVVDFDDGIFRGLQRSGIKQELDTGLGDGSGGFFELLLEGIDLLDVGVGEIPKGDDVAATAAKIVEQLNKAANFGGPMESPGFG